MKYRICKNKYDYYKIQRQQKEIKLFGITFRKEWVDCYTRLIFDTQEEAQKQIDRFVQDGQQQNKDWTCV